MTRRWTLAVAVLLAAVGCGRTEAVVDLDEPLPLEVYGILAPETEEERAAARRFELAVEEAIAECMRRQGFEYVVVPPGDPVDEDPVTAGAPIAEQEAWVERYGYGISTRFDPDRLDVEELRAFLDPVVEADPRARLLEQMTVEERLAWVTAEGDCEERALSELPPPDLPTLEVDPALWAALAEMDAAIASDPRYEGTTDRWRDCLRRRGWPFPDQDAAIEAITDRLWRVLELALLGDPTVAEELRSLQEFERSVAVDDFACFRDEVLPVQRAVEREYQARFVEEHPDLLPRAED